MRYLIMCEGTNEEVLINLLLEKNKLKITYDDLIGRRIYHARQIKHPLIITELKHYNDLVTVIRIGDKQNEKLNIPNDLKRIISKERIYKYCTKPELEILLIISENMLHEYEKVKKEMSPKEYAKKNIKLNGKKYDQSNEFLIDYYRNVNKLISSIKNYKKYKKHLKDEFYLADLLK